MTTDLTPTITDDEVGALPLADARADLLRELLTDTGAAAVPPRRSRRWLAPVAAAAALVAIAVPVGLGQLGNDGKATDPGTPTGPTGQPAASFQIRVVAASSNDPGDVDEAQQGQLDAFTCPAQPVIAPPDEAALTCDDQEIKYLLERAVVDGGIVSAQAEIPQNQVSWVVSIQLDDAASRALGDVSRELVGTGRQVGLLVDGELVSAPTFEGVIDTGQLQLGGEFTQADAVALADRLDDVS
jgi:hypothetical protein